jgi:serine/threonine protein kinase
MSPEAIKGAESIDGRSDLYALGAVSYSLMAGHPVFQPW